ncbi:MAG: DUF192 domain-containing protein [Candidatus Altimarinota bacterium]
MGCVPAAAQVITPDGEVLSIELAITREEKMQGLMHRTSLPENAGMLFVFDSPQPLSFWMRNTRIPLDVLFLDETGRIVKIHTMPPCPDEEPQCPSDPSVKPAQYGFELNAGRAQELGLEVGDQLRIQGIKGAEGPSSVPSVSY